MSPSALRLTTKELIKIIESRGFFFIRQKGSHMRYGNNNGIKLTIPNHGNKILHPKIVRDVLRESDMV